MFLRIKKRVLHLNYRTSDISGGNGCTLLQAIFLYVHRSTIKEQQEDFVEESMHLQFTTDESHYY